jgi:RNA polymerase sigma factor (sigma-70 family)
MNKTNPTDWLQVIAQLQDGDRIALLKVTRVITGYLTKYRAYELRDSWDDLCQEVLIAIIKSVQDNRIRNQNAFISYVGIITRNKLSDWIQNCRRAGGDEFLGDSETALAILDKTLSSNDDQQSQDQLMDLQQSLSQLPEREQKAITAIYLHGYSYAEAAKMLKLPLGTLKRLQTQGLKLLRQKMQTDVEKNLSDLGVSTDSSYSDVNLKPQLDKGS